MKSSWTGATKIFFLFSSSSFVILWREAERAPLPLEPCFALRRAEPHAVLGTAVKHPLVRLVLRLLFCSFSYCQVLGHEEGDGGGVNVVATSQ